MNHKTHMVVFIVFLAGVSPFLSVFASADDEVTINIHMIGQTARTRFNNPVMVAGIWHFINVTTENEGFQELTLKYYEGTSIPAEGSRNATNYYEWKYVSTNQQWTDEYVYEVGYPCIKNDSCQNIGNTYSFCVGIKDTLPSTLDYYENWTLEVYKDEDKLHSGTVVVEKPWSGLAKTHGDEIIFDVAPFTEMDDPGDDYIVIENTKNVPLYITITYGTYDDIIEFPGFNTTISPYSTSTHTPIVHSKSWQPQILTIEAGTGTITGFLPGSYVIPSPGYQLEPSPGNRNAPKLTINVGHSNYEIEPIEDTNITFQYEKTLEMSEDEIRDIKVYISGNGIVTFDVRSNENLSILKIFDNRDAEVNIPLEITSTNISEYNVTVRVKALRENTTGFLYYNLTIGEETEPPFVTQISIGPPESPAEETITLDIQIIIAIVVIIVIVMVYIIYTQMKYRRR